MDGCALSLTKAAVELPDAFFPGAISFERRHHYPRCADPQSEEHLLRDSTWKADGGQRRVGIGQELAGLRHHLRRGAAAVCRISFGLCAAVSGAYRKARCG